LRPGRIAHASPCAIRFGPTPRTSSAGHEREWVTREAARFARLTGSLSVAVGHERGCALRAAYWLSLGRSLSHSRRGLRAARGLLASHLRLGRHRDLWRSPLGATEGLQLSARPPSPLRLAASMQGDYSRSFWPARGARLTGSEEQEALSSLSGGAFQSRLRIFKDLSDTHNIDDGFNQLKGGGGFFNRTARAL
jgi:hypothetical protein